MITNRHLPIYKIYDVRYLGGCAENHLGSTKTSEWRFGMLRW